MTDQMAAANGSMVTARADWVRPEWVTGLGIYGRAAYEWRRATAPFDPTTLNELAIELRTIDRIVADQVRLRVQEHLRPNSDLELTDLELIGLEELVAGPVGLAAVTLAVEIAPCLEQVFQPTPARGGPFDNATLPSARQRQLLETETWSDRPSLEGWIREAGWMADAILEHGEDPVLLEGDPIVNAGLMEPTALFPTEVRVAHRVLRRRLGRPVDLYQLFN